MPHRRVTATALVLLLAAPALAQDDSAAGNWQKVVACAQDSSEKRRHDCIDRVLTEAGVLSDAKRAETTVRDERQNFGLSGVQQAEVARKAEAANAPAPVPSAAPVPPTPPVAAASPPAGPTTPAAPATAAAPLEAINTTVAKAFDPGNKLLVIITEDGQVWQQSESKNIGLPPKAGTAFTVEKGALGAFNCRIGNGRSFRCRRQG
ncbi:hypothetical protein [Tsuneonella sp. HG222]